MVDQTNVLLLIGQLERGGAERQLVELAKGLDKRRYRCTVCSLSKQIPIADELEDADLRFVSLKKMLPLDITRVPRLLALIHEEATDILHCFLPAANSWGRVAGELASVPVVIASVRNAIPDQKWVYTWINRVLAPVTDAVVVNASATKKLLIERREASPDQVELIYNGIDLARFDVAVDTREKRVQLALHPDRPVVAMVGRFVPQKDYATFLRAAHLVLTEHPTARFLCVGNGPLLPEMTSLVADLGIAAQVAFAGERDDVPEIMHAIDVLALSSRWEGLPNVIMEAMAARRPVVATNVGGIPELVVEGRTGFVVLPQYPQALASRIVELLKDPVLSERMGTLGRRRIEELFCRERMVAQTDRLYQLLLQPQQEDLLLC